MQNLIFLIPLLLSLLMGKYPKSKEQLIYDRIEYIYNLKFLIDEDVWKGFADKQFDLPLIYYTDSVSYIANPTEKFIASFQPNLVVNDRELKIYITSLLDSIPFHMETSITLGDTSSLYNHNSPFMNCSSLELTRQTVPDVNSTEEWATMIIHEYFHGFQLKHRAFLTFFENNVAIFPEDSLKKIYQSHKWFKESVDKENEMLLSALDSADDHQIRTLINSFFRLREQRRLQTRLKLNLDLKPLEKSFETMEGTARYVEYNLLTHFAKKDPDKRLIKSDTSYHSYKDFRNYKMESDQWLYLSDKTTYFYATGFNLVRLLEKLKINYQTRLFEEGDLSLEEILEQHWMEMNDR